MKDLLFLVHRIPFPPNKGDKIRSYHFLKGLTENYRIHLGTFIDDPDDWQYVEEVKSLTSSSLILDLNPTVSKIKSLSGLMNNKAMSVPYYSNQKMQQWIDETVIEKKINKVFVFSSVMGQFIEHHKQLDVVVDFVDVDSDKWAQYSKKTKWPMSWIYKRESRLLFDFDAKISESAKKSLFVSEDESSLFKKLVGDSSGQIDFVNNGVDTDYFNTIDQHADPFDNTQNTIVFTGAMDYWANVDAVTWFAEKVFPIINQKVPDCRFYIVGSKPSKEVLNLANNENVFVTGRVEDIRPYLMYAQVIVAPLLIARGIQNKILEAMAMGRKIVATPQAIEGINITDQAVRVEAKVEDFAHKVLTYLESSKEPYCAIENQQFVEQNFSWDASLKRLISMID